MNLVRAGCLVLLTVTPLVGLAQDNSRALADEIVRFSGIKAGLCVHLGCREGALTAELAGSGNFLVHGLDKDPATVEKTRQTIQSGGLNGRVSIEETTWRQPLPYPDNTVNLLVADDLPSLLTDGLWAREIIRVLAPDGVACIGTRAGAATPVPALEAFKKLLTNAGLKEFEIVNAMGLWARIRKPLDPRTDEYTHFMHNPGMNIVSNDGVVGPAGVTQLRWLNGPPYYFDSEWPLIAAHGAVFLGQQEWMPEGKRTQGILVARDAYNGCQMWRKPINYYSPRNMAAAGGRLYLYLPLGDKDRPGGLDILGALDIRTGETLFTVPEDVIPLDRSEGTCLGTVSIVDGTILVCHRHRPPLKVYAVDAATQKLLWKKTGPIQLVAGEGLVYVTDADSVSALDLRTGQEKWKLPFSSVPNLEVKTPVPAGGRLDLIHYAYGRLVLFNVLKDGTQVYGVSAKDGKYLWDYKYRPAFGLVPLSYPEEIWLTTKGGGRGDGFQVSLDPATGKEKRRYPGLIPTSCGPPRGARNYLLGTPKGSCGFLNLSTLEVVHVANYCRTSCQGQVPANGLQYFIPHGCICSGSLLRGFYATGADEAPPAISKEQPHPLIKGGAAVPAPVAGAASEWPLCRKDARRGNITAAEGPAELSRLWEAKVGQGRVSPPTVAGGLAYAADVEGLQVCAFDSATGSERWRFLTGCRVDVPPAIEKGLCLFGGRDGWVYCLNAQTGQLIWRYRAAPADRRIVVSGRMESSWPVVGGVLVQNGLAYVAAGRTSGVDGGIYLHALEPATGKCVQTANLKKSVSLTADWLVGDGTDVYIHGLKWAPDIAADGFHFRDAHRAPPGLLRTDTAQSIANVVWNMEPSPIEVHRSALHCGGKVRGQVVAFGENAFYAAGLGSVVLGLGNKTPPDDAKQYYLVSAGAAEWKLKLPLQFIAMVRAGKTLYCAGLPPDRDAAKRAELWAISADDGKVIGTVPLDAYPVPDGLAVADGRLYVAMQNGRVLCFGK